ncbi:Oidioi.mRNA.OKI2018_I69.XSR.g14422.t1.cds [Oikopleura dioica]|uniref:ATP synthase F(1) complex subunit delta, mitochondrial n=1 Tax=Oikopleura dioica TaxID=34765 RepID=A0ABN7SEP3_OIKDI|nr:Oidioi.mRNA.OKI2018_I69.XSR.g14422.t1.cds [Oikopleura dioica]
MLKAATRVSKVALRSAAEIPEGAMAFSFASPHEEFYTADITIKQVDIPTTTGMIGVLPSHVPTFGTLAPGVMTVISEASTSKFFISSGSYTVNPDSSVSVIAEEGAALSDFDKEAAQQALNAVNTSTPEGEIEAAVLSDLVANL